MNNKELSTIIDDIKLNIRVGAIIKQRDKILIEKNQNVDFSVIPGGRVKTLENSKKALIREINEELGLDLSNEKFELTAIIENFFIFDSKKYHELYFVYKVELTKEYILQDGMLNLDSQDSNYYLLKQKEFQKENILPSVLKEIVLTNEFKHYIVNNITK